MEIAVEVLRGVGLEASRQMAEKVLVQADRIGHRHDHDFAAKLAGGFQRGQLAAQRPRHQHAGQLVGMQRRLDVDLLPAAGTVVETHEVAGGAERRGNQRMGLGLHSFQIRGEVGRAALSR